MDLELVADEENENRTQRGEDQTGWVITFIRGPGKHVGDCAPEDGTDNSEDDRPEDRHVRVHH